MSKEEKHLIGTIEELDRNIDLELDRIIKDIEESFHEGVMYDFSKVKSVIAGWEPKRKN